MKLSCQISVESLVQIRPIYQTEEGVGGSGRAGLCERLCGEGGGHGVAVRSRDEPQRQRGGFWGEFF